MPRKRRPDAAGVPFHVLNRAAKRCVLFESAGDYGAFEQLLQEAAARHDVAIFSYCIMPNHWHFVLAPGRAGTLSRFMHWLTTTHARRWQNAHGLVGLGAVYQGRYKAIPISSDHHFLWVCRYVERNPLRAALADRAEAWRWSSLKLDRPSWLAAWPVARPPEWLSHVNAPHTMAELERIRHAVQRGIPFGSKDWQEQIMATGQNVPSRPRGRPRRHPLATVLNK